MPSTPFITFLVKQSINLSILLLAVLSFPLINSFIDQVSKLWVITRRMNSYYVDEPVITLVMNFFLQSYWYSGFKDSGVLAISLPTYLNLPKIYIFISESPLIFIN